MGMVITVAGDILSLDDLRQRIDRGEIIFCQFADGEELPPYSGTVTVENHPESDYVWWGDVVVDNNRIVRVR